MSWINVLGHRELPLEVVNGSLGLDGDGKSITIYYKSDSQCQVDDGKSPPRDARRGLSSNGQAMMCISIGANLGAEISFRTDDSANCTRAIW